MLRMLLQLLVISYGLSYFIVFPLILYHKKYLVHKVISMKIQNSKNITKLYNRRQDEYNI